MAIKSKQYTLKFDKEAGIWLLEHNKTEKIVKRFPTKEAATKRGVLKKTIGGEGSVIIRRNNGSYEEERFFT